MQSQCVQPGSVASSRGDLFRVHQYGNRFEAKSAKKLCYKQLLVYEEHGNSLGDQANFSSDINLIQSTPRSLACQYVEIDEKVAVVAVIASKSSI